MVDYGDIHHHHTLHTISFLFDALLFSHHCEPFHTEQYTANHSISIYRVLLNHVNNVGCANSVHVIACHLRFQCGNTQPVNSRYISIIRLFHYLTTTTVVNIDTLKANYNQSKNTYTFGHKTTILFKQVTFTFGCCRYGFKYILANMIETKSTNGKLFKPN